MANAESAETCCKHHQSGPYLDMQFGRGDSEYLRDIPTIPQISNHFDTTRIGLRYNYGLGSIGSMRGQKGEETENAKM